MKNLLTVAVLLLLLAVVVGSASADPITLPTRTTPSPTAPAATSDPAVAESGEGSSWLSWESPTSRLSTSTRSGSTYLQYGMSRLLWPHASDYAQNYGYLRALTPLTSDQWALHLCEDRHLRASTGMGLAISLTGKSNGAWLIAERAYIDNCLGVPGCTAQPYFVYRINGFIDGRDFIEEEQIGQVAMRYHPLEFNVLFRQNEAPVLPGDSPPTDGLELTPGRTPFVYFNTSYALPPEYGSNITYADFTGPRMGVKNSTNYYDEVCLMLRVGSESYGASNTAYEDPDFYSSTFSILSNKWAMPPDLEKYTWPADGKTYWLLCSSVPESGGYLANDLANYLPSDPGDYPPGMEELWEATYGYDYASYAPPTINDGF
ncbi:hypothetical protein KY359_00105 [Candidatus Woesearchaeota archaeon]|nr:hypothetical protein [Candidatus Woesearchaeota archaeon]